MDELFGELLDGRVEDEFPGGEGDVMGVLEDGFRDLVAVGGGDGVEAEPTGRLDEGADGGIGDRARDDDKVRPVAKAFQGLFAGEVEGVSGFDEGVLGIGVAFVEGLEDAASEVRGLERVVDDEELGGEGEA